MLEDDYTRSLNRLVEICECDVDIPSEWRDRLARRGVIQPVPDDRRKYVRHRFSSQAVLEYGETFSSIPRDHTIARVVTCDVSRSGLAFLHSEQLFPGEQVTLWLPIGKRSYVVAWCVEHNDNCFQVGVTVAHDGRDASTTEHNAAAN